MEDRKLKILQTIIDEYIQTGEPVGSRNISKKLDINLSPATIRNEMADLEEMGFLEQPHTSAGRVPSDKGYRFYVDTMLQPSNGAGNSDIEVITHMLENRIDELSFMLQRATRLLSQITGYPIVAAAKTSEQREIIKNVQIFPVEAEKAMVVTTTEAGSIHSMVILVPGDAGTDDLDAVSKLLRSKLHGCETSAIDIAMANTLSKQPGIRTDILLPALQGVVDSIRRTEDHRTYTVGAKNILEYPEFSDSAKAKELIGMLDEKGFIHDVVTHMEAGESDDDLYVSIGSENRDEKMRDCSIVAGTYDVDPTHRVLIGVIGPKRMDYARVVSVLRNMKKAMNRRDIKSLGSPGSGFTEDKDNG